MPDQEKGAEEVSGDVTREQSPVYTIDGLTAELRQAEIICNLNQYIRDPAAREDAPEGEVPVLATLHSYVVVLSQDCDLLWDFDARAKGQGRELNGVLVYEAEPANEARVNRSIPSAAWKVIRQNKNDRYHFLEAGSAV